MQNNYVSEGLTFQTGQGLKSIFSPQHLGLPTLSDIEPAFVKLRLCKIDAVLEKNRAEYAGRTNGMGGECDLFKFIDVMKCLESSNAEFMPFLLLRQSDPADLVVEDGRHRLAVLYEKGYVFVWCVVPAQQVDLFKAHYA